MAFFVRVNNVQELHHYIKLPPELTVNHPVFAPARILVDGRYLIGYLDYFSHIGHFIFKINEQQNVVMSVENFGFELLLGMDLVEWRWLRSGAEMNCSNALVPDPLAKQDDWLYYGRCLMNNRIYPGLIGNNVCHVLTEEDVSQHEHKVLQILVHKTAPRRKDDGRTPW
ncbi:Hypothetical predicted protein [Cloeon dipterum]|uniref:Uncharacterized protein n=1 Tax=Cloeon dipterum TaxID=197152 RepID=A0A8S1DXT2_9INSE|nr:Hypothetical predicted protein [Cloeon dipterum]